MVITSPKKLDLPKETKYLYVQITNENNNNKQKGGTYVTIIEKYGQYEKEKRKYPTGLDRWSWIKIKGNNKIMTTILSSYLP